MAMRSYGCSVLHTDAMLCKHSQVVFDHFMPCGTLSKETTVIAAAGRQAWRCMLSACRPFMEGPHMFRGRGTPPYEDDDHGMGRFGGNDSGAGDALAMGMDVDIPAATSAGDRREAERRRGRDGRYGGPSVLNAWSSITGTGHVRRPGRQHWHA